VPWGSHVSLFYETKEDLCEIVVPYLKAGLKNREFCLWLTSQPVTPRQARKALVEALPTRGPEPDARRFEVAAGREWYRHGNLLDLQKVAAAWDAKLAAALENGCHGLRVAASAVRLNRSEWKEFLDYEDRLNRFLTDKTMIVLCAYPLAALDAAEILDVARTHPSVIVKRSGEWETL
jgi:hypothetical protein